MANSLATIPRWYVPGAKALAADQNNTLGYFAYDGLGSVRGLFDSTGAQRSLTSYDPYGQVIEHANDLQPHMGFTGALTDESGMDYLNARTYNPQLGMFMSADPLEGTAANPGSYNKYGYVQGNPTNLTDPSGQCFELLLTGPELWEATVPVSLVCQAIVTIAATAAETAVAAAPIAVPVAVTVGAGLVANNGLIFNPFSIPNPSPVIKVPSTSLPITLVPTVKVPSTDIPTTNVQIVANRGSTTGQANRLPTVGTHPYVPPKQKGVNSGTDAVRVKGGGFIDEDGNVWEWAQDLHGGPHWDVQHPDGSHTNIGPKGDKKEGEDTHDADNF